MPIAVFFVSFVATTVLYHWLFCHVDDEMSVVFSVPLGLLTAIGAVYVVSALS